MANEDMEMTTEQFLALRADVKAILNALEGSERFGQKGVIQRVADSEIQIEKNRKGIDANSQDLKNFKTKIIAYTAGAAGTATAIIQITISYFG